MEIVTAAKLRGKQVYCSPWGKQRQKVSQEFSSQDSVAPPLLLTTVYLLLTTVLGTLPRFACLHELRKFSLQLLSTTIDILAQLGFSAFWLSLEFLSQQTTGSYNRGERRSEILNKRA